MKLITILLVKTDSFFNVKELYRVTKQVWNIVKNWAVFLSSYELGNTNIKACLSLKNVQLFWALEDD